MTPFGLAALLGGGGSLTLGLVFDWPPFDIIGIGLLAAVVLGFASVARPSRVTIEREIQPPRVPKGEPAIALLTFVNRGRRPVPTTIATQHFSAQRVRTVIPSLRGRERGTRAYRLPTTRRGVYDVEPVEIVRRDPFELFRLIRKQGDTQRIQVYPRVLDFARLPTGQSRYIEGPSSDMSPQGTITFHRLREYVPGDDLRLVHWRSSAHAGQLLIKHNVDTSQPYTVVMFDLRPARYTAESFEQAVDVVASVVVSAGRDKAPAELRCTDGAIIGGPQAHIVTPLIDYLTSVEATSAGSLREQLLALRHAHGGTELVVVTGVLDHADLPAVAALRRRFDRLVVVTIDPAAEQLQFPGVRIVAAADADAARDGWNLQARE
ncbi:DUF58 domain-containing protein [uncultured Jatrophihabitans sp.]|uniref:DUF58 domain-containing protein n=1 Tax=uncultured Jatrophihabitans sp. TaxID=1610747 RepID=UPI0035C9B371